MNIKELASYADMKIIDRRLDKSRALHPTTSGNCNSDELLFVYPRIGGGYSITPDKITGKPYAIVCDGTYAKLVKNIPLLITDNTRVALSHAAYLDNDLNNKNLKIVAITGTNGKTTTATFLSGILNHAGIRSGQIGTGIIKSAGENLADTNYSMTTPDPIELYSALGKFCHDNCPVAVIEATSHAIALDKLAPLKFERGIFTNLSSEHMDFHKSSEQYFSTKLSLFKKCRGGIFNIDDEYGERAYNLCDIPKTSVGIINRGEAYATDIESDGWHGTRFIYRETGLMSRVDIRLPGVFNVYNAMLAMRCAIELGLTPKEAKDGLASVNSVPGRMEVIRDEPVVIIDYAHTPVAMINVLKTLNKRKNNRQKLILVFGCGGERDQEKRPLMAQIAEKYADLIILTNDNSRGEKPEKIAKEIIIGFSARANYTYIPDRAKAIKRALESAGENDIVAIIGKGHEKYIIDSDGKHPFDERAIVDNFYSANE